MQKLQSNSAVQSKDNINLAVQVLAFYQQKIAGVKRKVDATITDLNYSLQSDSLTAEQRVHILNAGAYLECSVVLANVI